MKLRTLLLGTTSLCLLSFMPLAANAQDAGLAAAYNAYVSASSGDDADAKAAAEAAFLAECQRVGEPNLDACIAIATGAAGPAAEESPPAEEPPPPAEQPPAEQPAPEQPEPEQPAPEQPTPEQPPAEQPAPEQPAPEQPAPEQPAPEQPAPEQPAPKQPAPDQPPAASPAEDQALLAAFESYVAASTGTDETAKANAQAAFLVECNRVGIATIEECLAVMGGGAPAPTPPAEQPATETPATEQPATPAPDGETPPVTEAPVEEAIPNVETPDAPLAPVLDSQKEPEGQPPADQPAATVPDVAPPTTDAEAQIAPPVTPEDIEVTLTTEGTRIEALPIELPPDVEVVNQTNDNRFVINIGINVIFTPYKDRDRIGRDARDVYYEELPNGRVRQTVIRNDGTEIITVWNRFGEIERRIKVRPDGTRVVLVYYNGEERGPWRDPGDDLPPFRLNIPVNEYVIYSEEADEDELVAFLDQPPLEPAARVYSVDEVKYSARIRDTVRKVDIGDITFDTGEATVEREQVGSLTKVAQAMLRLIEENPGEVFLIEGHTDAVGSDESNLELSDRRAETIADLLVDIYNVPAENLTTQGYGEEYLKVLTEGPERANRRATVRRITPLVSSADNA